MEFLRLEGEHLGALRVDLDLLAELVGLDLEHLRLVPDLSSLTEPRQEREDCSREGQDGEGQGGEGRELGREDERHAEA